MGAVVSICIAREGSKGFPGKNTYEVSGKSMMIYPLTAADGCKDIHYCILSTESDKLIQCYERYIFRKTQVLRRPVELATDAALADDVFVNAYNWLKSFLVNAVDEVTVEEIPIEFVVLLFGNAPCITSEMISDMIHQLRDRKKDADSICTVSKYNMFSPSRMRHLSLTMVHPTLPLKELYRTTCDRDSSGDYYIYDCSCAVVKPWCLENIEHGTPPQRWLGRRTLYYNKYREIPALDVDYEWQLGQVEKWIERYWEE